MSEIKYSPFEYEEVQYKLLPNSITKFDNSKIAFPEVSFFGSSHQAYGAILATRVIFSLAQEYREYEQYVDYQPYFDSSRNLSSENEKKKMPPQYFILYILAQVGGLYIFLKILFGC